MASLREARREARDAAGAANRGWTTRGPGDRWRRLSPAEARKPALGRAGGCPEWRDGAISDRILGDSTTRKINRPGDHRAQRPGQINATGDRGQHDRRNQPTGGSANGSTGQITGERRQPADAGIERSGGIRIGEGQAGLRHPGVSREPPGHQPARATCPRSD